MFKINSLILLWSSTRTNLKMLKRKNEATMLLKIKDRAKKRSQNEAIFRRKKPRFLTERTYHSWEGADVFWIKRTAAATEVGFSAELPNGRKWISAPPCTRRRKLCYVRGGKAWNGFRMTTKGELTRHETDAQHSSSLRSQPDRLRARR